MKAPGFAGGWLLFFLYKCGGFVPSALEEHKLVQQHSIHRDRIVRRHGTHRDDQLRAILSDALYKAVETRRGGAKPDPFSQSDKIRWNGGYFDIVGKNEDRDSASESTRAHWRKEYLPGPTQLLATAFCAALAGALRSQFPQLGRLRVTLHRAILLGNEELLQQACDYQGTEDAREEKSAAARTFPSQNGTIGLAYRCRRIVRSLDTVKPEQLNAAMGLLKLHAASRKMSEEVGFVLAIPLLEPEIASRYTAPSPVIGVIYIDSKAPNFFINNADLKRIVSMASEFLEALLRTRHTPLNRIGNVALAEISLEIKPAEVLPQDMCDVFALVAEVDPPRISEAFYLNYDYSDFLFV